jgi:cysteine dioxygenase
MDGRRQLLECFGRWDERSSPIPYEVLYEGLSRLELAPDDLDGLFDFDEHRYRRVSVHGGPHYEALVLGWRSGQGSPIHDHAGSSCVVRVVKGRATETRFAGSPCGRLVPRSSRAFPAGSVLGCRGAGIHQMANLEAPGLDLVTLHVYSPPPSRWRYYPLDRTTLAANDSLIRERPETLVLDLAQTVLLENQTRRRQLWGR